MITKIVLIALGGVFTLNAVTLAQSEIESGHQSQRAPDSGIELLQPKILPTGAQGERDSGGITLGEIEAGLARLEADKQIEDGVKNQIRKIYKQASAALGVTSTNFQLAGSYREAIYGAPPKTEAIRIQLEKLPSAEEAGTVSESFSNVNEIKQDIESKGRRQAKLEVELAELEVALTRAKGRPIEIAERLPKSINDLTDIGAKLDKFKIEQVLPPRKIAEQILLQAQQQLIKSDIEMLKQEQLSQEERTDLLTAKRTLLTRQVKNGAKALGNLNKMLTRTMQSEADEMTALVERLAQTVKGSGDRVEHLAAQTLELAHQYEDSVRLLKKAATANEKASSDLVALTSEILLIEEEAKLGGFKGAFAQILVEQRNKLPNLATLSFENARRQEIMREARLADIHIEKKKTEQIRLEKELVGALPAVSELLVARHDLLEKLSSDNRRLIRNLAELDTTARTYQDKVVHFRTYLHEKLFWLQSSPPVGMGGEVDWRDAISFIFGVERWSESWIVLKHHTTRHPASSSLILFAALCLLLARPKIIAAIRRSGDNILRISTDRYIFTLHALLGTALLTVPIPLIVWYLGMSLSGDPDGSNWLQGLSSGLVYSSFIIALVLFLGAACIRGGIGIAHFGWNEKSVVRFRRALAIIFVIYVPGLLITSSTFFVENPIYFDSVGRFCINVANLWTTLVLWRLLRPSDGIFTGMLRDRPNRLMARFCYVWYITALLAPLFLIVLACLGYVSTAISLSLLVLSTFGLIVLGVFVFNLSLRWFLVKERKLALAEAIEVREARKAAAANPEEIPDEEISTDDSELELDLSDIGRQTRRLLRSLASIGVVVAIWFLWSERLPLDHILGASSAGSRINSFQFAQAILIAATFIIVVRNLPGLLELAGLRSTALDPGTRYAVIAICQYSLGAIGIVMVTNALGIDWSRFSWIAAALSVGLGFGLQEVVANFVCGIILLFERPIRIGDIVTIENVTGTVTRIRMRATTITDWDRKEFVVPNKQFVTGTLMNWTLSSSVNRIIIEVGVAYGSDTEKAREILLDVARDHPRVLDDPPPLATFELFADSSLNLLLRCYLPELDNRVNVISDLHTEIHQRLQKAGIEIPFPQRDLHVRSIDPSAAEEISNSAD